jgi:hypothetical protein
VHADPAWYSNESPFNRSRLYFYLPYIDYMGDVNIGFNHILKALFPDVPIYIGQAGSVAATALNVADMICGESSDKRIYIGTDFSWVKGSPRRAALRYGDLSPYSESLRLWYENNMVKLPDNVIDVAGAVETLQTDLLSVSYATQLFWFVHWQIQNHPYAKDRFVLLTDASKLFLATANAPLPHVAAPADAMPTDFDKDFWAYKVVLGLIRLFDIKENDDGQSKESTAPDPSLDT